MVHKYVHKNVFEDGFCPSTEDESDQSGSDSSDTDPSFSEQNRSAG